MSERESTGSPVYFAGLRGRSKRENLPSKLGKLFEKAGFQRVVKAGGLCAVKLHFGESGNVGYVHPVLVRALVDKVLKYGSEPFLTDTNTVYSGSRFDAVGHLRTAAQHGFGLSVAGAPVLIADGLRGADEVDVKVQKGKHVRTAKIASAIAQADSMLVISHFKGHEMAGFGGALKNLAMGCASQAGKRVQHHVRFEVRGADCVGCAECLKVCPAKAVTVAEKKASIDKAVCVGCGECLTVCRNKAIFIDWATDLKEFLERMGEYAQAAIKGKKRRVGFVNFLMNITPDCDCVPWSDAPIVADLGFLASSDPVALDQACLDMVNAQPANPHSHLGKNLPAGQDKFHGLWPHARGEYLLEYAEALGVGQRAYELVPIDKPHKDLG